MSTESNLDQPQEPDQRSGEPASNFGPDANRQTLQSLEDASGELARAMGLPGSKGQAQREALILAARRILNAPDLNGVNLKTPEWDSHRQGLDELLTAGTALAFIRASYGQSLTPETWTQAF